MKVKTSKKTYPSKQTLNLCIKEKPQVDPVKAVPLCILVIALVALLGKFAVIDRLQAQAEAKQRINEARTRFETLTEEIKAYDGIEAEYEMYSVGWLSDNEKLLVLRTDMIKLINEEIAPTAKLARVSMAGNVLSAELKNTNLNETSKLVSELNKRDDVEKVAVYTASSDSKNTSVSVVITMKDGGDR